MKKYRKLESLKFLYEISKDGELRNIKSKKVLKPYDNPHTGYRQYSINNPKLNQYRNQKVQHRLIAEAWLPIPDKYKHINIHDLDVHHKDENKLNNDIKNLEWMSKEDHQIYHNDKDSPGYISSYIGSDKQIKSWKHNLSMDGEHSPKEPVECMETGRQFESRYEAARWIKQQYPRYTGSIHTIASKIGLVTSGKRKTAYKHTWKSLNL